MSSGASDLHLRSGEPPLLRLHGGVREEMPPLSPERLETMLLSVMTARETVEFRDTSDTDWAYEIAGLARFRCNAARDRHGPIGVFRVIPTTVMTADEMGLSREIQNLCYLTKGLVVVTGPTGSGKSTTLAALVDLINRTRTDHIITIEDPIEFVHASKKCLVTQRQVGLHTRSFKQALRAALGRTRTSFWSARCATWRPSRSPLRPRRRDTSCSGRCTRPPPLDHRPHHRSVSGGPAVAGAGDAFESLRGVIAQTLCKKIGGGRVAAREVLLSIPAVSNLIREGKTFQIPSIMQTNRRTGMVTLNDALMELVEAKLVEPKEAYMKSVEKAGFAAALKAKRHDTSFLLGE